MSKILHCSFCNKSQDAIEKLIASAGGETYICNECVRVCEKILDDDEEKPPELPAEPPRRPPTWLLRMLNPETESKKEEEHLDSSEAKAPSK